MNKKGILLLSGGVDSTTLLARVLKQGWVIYPLSINYGQKHIVELEAAKQVVAHYQHLYKDKVKDLKILNFDLSQIGHSSLIDDAWEVPDDIKDQIQTVVPFRNTLLATLAAAYGESLKLDPIIIFMTPVLGDFAVYRDCRRGFYDSLEKTLCLGSTQETKVEIMTPFIYLTKAEVIDIGMKLAVPYHLTYSCYKGLRPACGKCSACIERLEAFRANGLLDPLEYRKE